MALTSPDNLFYPLVTDPALPQANVTALATSVQTALTNMRNTIPPAINTQRRAFFWTRTGTSAQNIPTATFTDITISGNAPQLNQPGFGYSGATITISEPGVYEVNFSAQFAGNSTGVSRFLKLATGPGIVSQGGVNSAGSRYATMHGSAFVVSGSEMIIVNSGSTLTLQAYQDSTVTLGITYPTLSIVRVGDLT